MIKAAILAGQGEHTDLPRLVQLLHDHPDVELISYADTTKADMRLDELYPALTGETDLRITAKADVDKVDVVFIAASPETAQGFMLYSELPENLYIIDMSGLYRLPAQDNKFIQGIPELNRKAMVRGARYVAMPDPTTTAVALSLLPLAKNLMLNAPIHTQAVSHDPQAESNALTAEIMSDDVKDGLRAALASLQNSFASAITGIEFRGDTTEGLIAVTTVDVPVDLEEIKKLYNDFYDDHNFTFVVDSVPDITDARDTNKAFIHLDKKDNTLVITTVLDTEFKGGAGNAVHAMNLLFGLIEKVGL